MTSVVRMVDRLVTAGVALALLVAGGWLIGYRVNLRAARESAERLQPVVLTHTAEWPWWPAASANWRSCSEPRMDTQNDLPLVLTPNAARAVADRWLAESRAARDIAGFALPPSAMGLGAGDVVEIAGETYRIDRVEQTEMLTIDAVR